jgi:hypothetical protein
MVLFFNSIFFNRKRGWLAVSLYKPNYSPWMISFAKKDKTISTIAFNKFLLSQHKIDKNKFSQYFIRNKKSFPTIVLSRQFKLTNQSYRISSKYKTPKQKDYTILVLEEHNKTKERAAYFFDIKRLSLFTDAKILSTKLQLDASDILLFLDEFYKMLD